MKNRRFKLSYLLISVLILTAIIIFSIAVNSGLITVDSVYRDPVISTVTESEFSVTFLNVGYGDCAYIKYGDCDILIDSGGDGSYTHIADILNRCGADDLELVIVAHFDDGNMRKLAENFKIDKVWSNSGINGETPNSFEYNGLTLSALFYNGDSVVVKVTYGNTKFLFTGDITQSVERTLIEQGEDVSADVIQIARHGSDWSSGEKFLKAVNPALAVISVGDNHYGMPSAKILERLALLEIPYYRTDLHGDIVVTSDGEALTVITSKT